MGRRTEESGFQSWLVLSCSSSGFLTGFQFSADFDSVAGYPTMPESDIQEYHHNVECLDQVLASMEKYIHIAYAALKNEDVVQRMFTMVSSVMSGSRLILQGGNRWPLRKLS
jgi:hypothetical protein